MKALTLHQPWASLLALGFKPDETRSWRTKHRGPLAIHASVAITEQARQAADNEHVHAFLLSKGLTFDTLPRGCFIGHCHVVDVVPTAAVRQQRTAAQLATGDYGPRRYAWLIQHPGVMPAVECKGGQRLWNVPGELVSNFKLQAH